MSLDVDREVDNYLLSLNNESKGDVIEKSENVTFSDLGRFHLVEIFSVSSSARALVIVFPTPALAQAYGLSLKGWDVEGGLRSSSVTVPNRKERLEPLFTQWVANNKAVVTLQTQPFDRTTIAELFDHMNSSYVLTHLVSNDIYGQYLAQSNLNVKFDIIYPATQKHILKAQESASVLFPETPELYRKYQLPLVEVSCIYISPSNLVTHHVILTMTIPLSAPQPNFCLCPLFAPFLSFSHFPLHPSSTASPVLNTLLGSTRFSKSPKNLIVSSLKMFILLLVSFFTLILNGQVIYLPTLSARPLLMFLVFFMEASLLRPLHSLPLSFLRLCQSRKRWQPQPPINFTLQTILNSAKTPSYPPRHRHPPPLPPPHQQLLW